MFISTNLYLTRLNEALEKVIAPEVESDEVRGQVFAVISLIEQFMGRIEYKHDFIEQEIDSGVSVLKRVIEATGEAGLDMPAQIGEFLQKLDDGKAGAGLALCDKVDEMLCIAIDLLHGNRDKVNSYKEVDKDIRDHIFRMAGRDMGLMKPPMIEKISRPEKLKKS